MIKNILAGILSSILLFCNSNIEIIASASNGLAEVDFFSTETNDNYTEYNGHFYKRYDMNMSWDEARKYCDSLGGGI